MPYRITELFPAFHTEATPYIRPKKLNIFLCDVSGSMGWCIKQLADDLAVRIKRIPHGDMLVVGIFSSPGFYQWIVKTVLNSPESYEDALLCVQRELYDRGTTCFSEILDASVRICELWKNEYPVITLTFMSDGCPVVQSIMKEDKAIKHAVKELAPFLTSGVVVAYGDYADIGRLTTIASGLGAEIITARSVAEIGDALLNAVESSTKKRRKVKIPRDLDFAFTIDNDGNVSHVDVTKEEMFVPDGAIVYKTTGKMSSYPVTEKNEPIEYAFALALLQQRRIDDAVNVLSNMGDVYLTNLVNCATTNAEIGQVESLIREAVKNPQCRYLRGKMLRCKPKDDAFDLLDLLTLLLLDEECRFYPRHPAFTYKRMGRLGVTKDGYPVFDPYDIAIPLSRMVGHKTELNLSVGVSIPGSIVLPHVLNVYGENLQRPSSLPERYKTHVFRNYALIANAVLRVTRLPVIVGGRVQEILERHGIVEDRVSINDLPIILDLSRVPLCNRKRGEEAAHWGKLADLAFQSLHYGSILKVFRDKRKELDPDRSTETPVVMTEEEWRFLSACGVTKDGTYSPPIIEQKNTDVLTVKTFEIRVNHSSPVSVKELKSMIEGKRKWNLVGELMYQGIQKIQTSMPNQKAEALAWLHEQIEDYERLKRRIDMEIYSQRLAVALTGIWPRHFSKDEATTATSDGHEVSMRFREIEKKI